MTFELPAYGVPPTRLLLRPGLRLASDVMLMVDGVPRRASAIFEVVGSVCPDPAAHVRDCDETNHDQLGDCDGDVRQYRVHDAGVAGKCVDDTVLLCAAHAQMNGSRIRRIAR